MGLHACFNSVLNVHFIICLVKIMKINQIVHLDNTSNSQDVNPHNLVSGEKLHKFL